MITTAPENKVNEAKNVFNSFDQRGRLEFTWEIEVDNKINFLDLTPIHMNNQKILTNWYSKETASNRIIKFLSTHPPKMKENFAVEFANSVMTLSDPIFTSTNIKRIKEKLHKNNFPMRVIHKAIETDKHRRDQRNHRSHQSTTTNAPEPKRIFRSMPYIPNLSQALNRQLKCANPDLTIAPKQFKQLGNQNQNKNTER